MSFGKLLATGKSLVSGRYDSRYRTDNRAFLPKFGSTKNPFASLPNKDAIPPQPASPEVPAQSLAPQPTIPVAQTAPRPTLKGAEQVSVLAMAGQGFGRLAKMLNPLSWFVRHPRPVNSVIPRFGHKPVQGELHLEKVRVVRNDLSDADLEVVHVGASGNKNLPSGTAWSHLTARIFGRGPRD